MTVSSNTVHLHRIVRTTPERLHKAFLDPEAIVQWRPPLGFTGRVHEMDATVGGRDRMSFTNFGTGKSHSFGGTYLELVPHERIGTPTNLRTLTCRVRYRSRFKSNRLPAGLRSRLFKQGFRKQSRSSSVIWAGRNL